MSAPDVAVLTIVQGRHRHLREQIGGLARQEAPPRWHVIVAMGDPMIEAETPPRGSVPWETVIVRIDEHEDGLPLAAARNRGAAAAIGLGAEVLVFLDVDCIPGPRLVSRYARAVRERRAASPALWCGEVFYLPPRLGDAPYPVADLDRLGVRREGQPALSEGEWRDEPRFELFWSLSFAMRAEDFELAGGFDEGYVGYGAEDTDFAVTVRSMSGSLSWLGDCPVYHQYHETRDPPVQHLRSILRNAAVFHRRWGWWPMQGWLLEFERLGLARRDERGNWGPAA